MGYWSPWGNIETSGQQAFYFFESVVYNVDSEYVGGCDVPSPPDGYDLSLHLKSDGSLLFNTNEPISGFQLTFPAGTILTGASGGLAAAADFMITNSSEMVIAFSLSGSTVAGCGTLINLAFESFNDALFSQAVIVVSDAAGFALDVSIAHYQIGPDDWVGVFKGDKCVGARQWDTSECGGGMCDVAAGGNDGISEGLVDYMQNGDIPTFKIFHSTSQTHYTTSLSATADTWVNNGEYVYDQLIVKGLSLEYDLGETEHGGPDNDLISFPIAMPDTAVAVLFPNTGDYTIHAIMGEGQSAQWNAGASAWQGTLMNLSPTSGYWINHTGGPVFTIEGDFIENPVYDLHSGPNLISYPGHARVKIEDALPIEMYSKILGIIGEGVAAVFKEGSEGYVFDGSGDRIQFTCNNTRHASSWSFWAKTTSPDLTTIFSHGNPDIGMLQFQWTGHVRFTQKAGVGGVEIRFEAGNSSSQYDGEWHHYVLTFDNVNIGNTRFWMDDVEWATNMTGGIPTNFDEWLTGLTIGSAEPSGSFPGTHTEDFEGEIKDFAWFDVVLSDANVTTIYNGGVPTNLAAWGSDLRGYWRFDGTADDSSGNGCDGTVEGARYYGEAKWIGSLTKFEPSRGYWFVTNENFSFQYILDTVAQCSNLEYSTEAGCTGAGYYWVQMLSPGA